jgi:N-carbamoyl-L-amino-acid hydrolase
MMATHGDPDRIAAAAAIDAARLWSHLVEFGEIGGIGGGGVCRLALGEEELLARRHIVGWARTRGYRVFVDPVANLFVRRDGTDPEAAPVITGSHIDTQPQGGRFDGAYGVIAGLEALAALDGASVQTRRPIEVVAWTNEEGVRFTPGAMGSMVFSGALALRDIAERRGSDGVTLSAALASALAATPEATFRPTVRPVAAYVEAHIEQGPELEAKDIPIGVVEGIQGVRWFDVDVVGSGAHAGTTPLSRRRDAFQDALRIVNALNEWTSDPNDVLRFTVGRFEVTPNSRNTVPARVRLGIDLRHPDAGVLREKGDRIAAIAAAAAGRCEVSVREVFAKAPATFDPQVTDCIETAARLLRMPSLRMPSGAFHDALFLNDVCPTGMIFIPCERGISHDPAESITSAQAAAGARVLAATLVALAN